MNHEAYSIGINRTQMPYMGGLESGKFATYLGDLSLNQHASLCPHTSKPSRQYRTAITRNSTFSQGKMAAKPDFSEFSAGMKNSIYYSRGIDVMSDTKCASVPLPTQIRSIQPSTEQSLLTLDPYIRPVSASEIAASVHVKKVKHSMSASAAISSFPEMSTTASHTHLLQRNSFLRPLNGTAANRIKQTCHNTGNIVALMKQDICDSSPQRQNSFDSDSSRNSCSSKNSATFSNTSSLCTAGQHKYTDSFSSKPLYTSPSSSLKMNASGSQASFKLDMNTNFNSAKFDMESGSHFKQSGSMYDMPSQSGGIFPSILSESHFFTTPNSVKSSVHDQPAKQTLTSGINGASGCQAYRKVPVTSTLTGLVYYKRFYESKANSILTSENRNSSNMAWQNLYEKTAVSGTLTPTRVNHASILPNGSSSFEKSGTSAQSYRTPATETRTEITYHTRQGVALSAKLLESGKSTKPPSILTNVGVVHKPADSPLMKKDTVQYTLKLLQDKHFQKASEIEVSARKNSVVVTAEQRPVGDGALSNTQRFSEVPQTTSYKVNTTQNAGCDEEENDDCDDEGNDDAFSGSLEEDEKKESLAKGKRLPGDGVANSEETDEDSELENFEDNSTDDGTTDSSSGNKSNFKNCKCPMTADSQAHAEESSILENCPKSANRPSTATIPDIIKPAFRYSLFCNIPPTINFVSEGERAEQLPLKLSRLLRWKISPITPSIVKATIDRVGFRISKKNHDWLGCFGKHMKSNCFKSLHEYQKLNHFPGSFQIGRKDKLWRSLSKMQLHFGKQEFNFFPQTFILPADMKQLRQVWEESGIKQKWIIKPPASARGIGIRVISKWSQIPRRRAVIVQKYIHRPFLINSSKFDMRIYVYVSCYDPLRLYVYEDGLARFASCKYSSSSKTFNNRFMHLTNYSINKKNADYLSNTDNTVCQGHKWSLKALWNYMKRQGINTNLIWETIRDLIIKTIISGDSVICSLTKFNTSSRYCCHELFGFDILLDENFKPWILEVNISPSLHSNSELDVNIKGAMIKDMLNIAGFRLPDERDISNTHTCIDPNNPTPLNAFCMDKRLFTTQLAPDERSKHTFYCQKYLDEQAISSILNILTPDDIRILCESIDEDSRKGNFQRLFPTPNTYCYLRYFEQPRYYNLLLDQWVLHYNHKEMKGIQLLHSYCEKGIHLQNPTTDPQHQWTVPKPSFTGMRSSDTRVFGLLNSARDSGHNVTGHRNVKKLPVKSEQLSHSSSSTSLRSLAPSPHVPQSLNPATSSSSSLQVALPTTSKDLIDIVKEPN
ncbi:hypothetical protein BsWGS_05300 [Bradybaena similaris]